MEVGLGYHFNKSGVRRTHNFAAVRFDIMNQFLIDQFVVAYINITEYGYLGPAVDQFFIAMNIIMMIRQDKGSHGGSVC
jgi:hypothetical protein